MKINPISILGVLILITLHFSPSAQQTINASITHDGLQRDYILYVPANYTGGSQVPLILNFHGYGSDANGQMWYGDFRSIADTAGFIVVHPLGTVYQTYTHWNVGGWIIGSTVDDVGFTAALIDSISASYSIDASRVYSTGMSNGGFMSFLLSCQLSDKIAAIASVGGSMTPGNYAACNPQHPTPILQIHGTVDATVPYTGDSWTRSIDDVISYWVGINNTNLVPTITPFPNINTTDGSTVEHVIYDGGDNGVTVEHMKITGGGHTWPSNIFGGTGTNYDIDASYEIWKFFSRYDLNGFVGMDETINNSTISVYPNPTQDKLTLKVSTDFLNAEYFILDNIGRVIGKGMCNTLLNQINLADFNNGSYILKLGEEIKPIKIIKQ